jgi:chromate transporter
VTTIAPNRAPSAREVLREFLRLGIVGFGGPSAHLALFRQRFVRELGWLDEQQFLDTLGAANLLPGPTSTEVALAIGRHRAGMRGLLAAAAGFILPAALMVLALAVVYQAIGDRPEVSWVLYGIQPVVVAVVAVAVAGLAPTALRGPATAAIALLAGGIMLFGFDPILAIVAGAICGVGLAAMRRQLQAPKWLRAVAIGPSFSGPARVIAAAASGASTVTLATLFAAFLKVGLFAFGSGYVLIAFLRSDLVASGLMTDHQLLDAVAIGQVTPGPVYTTATFIGYLLAGVPGAVVSTVAIFLPGLVAIALVQPYVPRLRSSPLAGSFLDAVNATALGVIAAVTLQLARSVLVDPLTVALAVAALAVLLVRSGSAVVLLLAGGIAGYAVHAMHLV